MAKNSLKVFVGFLYLRKRGENTQSCFAQVSCQRRFLYKISSVSLKKESQLKHKEQNP